MGESLKFFKVDETSVYQDGYIYSFYRDLDSSKPSADPQWLASFHCSLKSQKNCRGQVHTTANWETDKRGRNFQWGVIKNGNHSHEPEQRDTTRVLKFYKNAELSVIRNGYTYAFYRYLVPPKPSGDFQWYMSYHCSTSANNQESCRARIYTTGQWNIDKRGKEYQWGTFKNCEHSHEILQVSITRQETAADVNHKCNICSYSSANSGHLACNMRIHTGEKPFKCGQCSFASTQNSSLKIHMRTHTRVKPYKCDQCSYATTTSSALKRHMRSHAGQKPYKCKFCSYASVDASALQRHVRIHTGEKPYKCTKCPYAGTEASSLKWHTRAHHSPAKK